MNSPFQQFRREYKNHSLSTINTSSDPFIQFNNWFVEATDSGIGEPNAMALATVSSEGMPSIRIVLLKDVEPDGYVFFTNYHSRKGSQLEKNPQAALLFFWPELERQVRIEGRVVKTDPEYSDNYFNSRTAGSRAGAVVSPQSRVISSREPLESAMSKLLQNQHKDLRRPEYWGGYKLIPELFEFWQGREHRLHDRIQYRKNDKNWIKERLAP